MTTTVTPWRAFAGGLAAVLKAPMVIVAAAVVTTVIALPFAMVLGSRVQASLALQPPVSLDETEIDPEWWHEFQAHARGLDATFTPAIIGFAAPLDTLSAVLDGRRPPLPVLGLIALSIVAWAFLWGGALRRYGGAAIGARGFVAAGMRMLPRFAGIAAAAAIAIAILYFTLHVLLFGPVYGWLAALTSSERTAFALRVVLYVLFFAPVAFVGLVADYARAASIAGAAGSLGESIRAGAAFVRAHCGAVVTLYLLGAAVFATVTITYGVLEIYGGSQVGGWRAIAIGQFYILVRLVLRLTAAAAELRLFAGRSTL